MKELVDAIILAYAMNQYASLNDLLDEAPSFELMRSLEVGAVESFYDALRRAEIEHKSITWREYLFTALTVDDAAEEIGMHSDDRVTCHTCRAWADHTH